MNSLLFNTYIVFIVTFCSQTAVIKQSSLTIDRNMAAYIDSQAAIDGAYQVIVVADTIYIAANMELHDIDLIFVCNVFVGDFTVTVRATKSETGGDSVQGRVDGHAVQIIARNVHGAKFHLSGEKGKDGLNGDDGANGDSMRVIRWGDNNRMILDLPGTAPGQPGRNGTNGLKGGHGGSLRIFSVSAPEGVRLEAPGAAGGEPGQPGNGGITYIVRATEATRRMERDLQKLELIKRNEPRGKPGLPGVGGGKERKPKTIAVDERLFLAKVKEYSFHELSQTKTIGWQIYFFKIK